MWGFGATEAHGGLAGALPGGGGGWRREVWHTGMAVCSLWTRSAPSRHGLLIVDAVGML